MSAAKHTAGPAVLRAVANPFRSADRRKQFDGMVRDYSLRNRTIFRFPSGENRSNNIGEAFWRGFHGERFIWDREAPIYVAYKAGAAIAKATGSAA